MTNQPEVRREFLEKDNRVVRRLRYAVSDYVWATFAARRLRPQFESVRCYCMFVGYPRSGHSLIGSLLNAHRSIVIGHELDALRYVWQGYSRDKLFALIIANDRNFTKRGRQWMGWDYNVPGQWHGRYDELRVIGDKSGGLAAREILRDPGLLDALRDRVRVPVKVLHITRNPFDNIATMYRRGQPDVSPDLPSYIARFFEHAEGAARTIQMLGDDVLTTRHEAFTAAPRQGLATICNFLGVSVDPTYLDACAERVFKVPRKTRHDVPWTAALVERVEQGISKYPFLRGYTFDSPAVAQARFAGASARES